MYLLSLAITTFVVIIAPIVYGVKGGLTVLGLNLLGDGLRDILDPHITRQRR
jgi:ABC-type dipeptide/oligopeptide/nickel transport system permease subunit